MQSLRPAVLALFALTTGCAGAKEAAIRGAMDEIWNQGNLELIDRAYEPELANEIKAFVTENRALYDDLSVTIDDVIVKGNRYVTLWTVTGKHKDLHTLVVLHGVSVRTREGGVFTREEMFFDRKAIYDQLGFKVTPPEGLSPFDVVMERGEEAAEAGAESPAEDAATGEGAADEPPVE